MKILQVHNRYRSSSPSGENRVVDNEASALRRHGHVVDQFERFSEEIEGWSAPKRALLPGRVVWSTEAYRALTRHLRQQRPDVVHVHNTFPLLSPSVFEACFRERVPVVVTLHNYRPMCPTGELFRDGAVCHDCAGRLPVPAVRHGCYRGSSLATLPLAASTVVNRRRWREKISAYVCISESQRQILRPLGLPEERVFVKTNLIPALVGSPGHERRGIIVFTGRIAKAKGVDVLMEAWDRYSGAPTGGPLRLVIAGAGPLDDVLSQWARDRADVEYVGILSPTDCTALLETARATVVPSVWEETFGLVVVEAMRAGVAVIASDHGSFPELLVDGTEGRLFPPGDAAALANVFHDVASEPDRYVRFGANGRKAYETRFDPDANVMQLMSIYEFATEHPAWKRRPPAAPNPDPG